MSTAVEAAPAHPAAPARPGAACAGVDHVADGVGQAEPTAFSTAPSRRITSALMPCSSRKRAPPRVRGGDPGVGQVAGEANGRAGGEAERRGPERQVEHLLDVGAGVHVQVTAGDAEVEVARGDVHGDVARAQVEELDVVVGVDAGEVLVVGALPVAGLAEHVDGGGGEATLVGNGDSEHEVS
jgi:hypothetical protein